MSMKKPIAYDDAVDLLEADHQAVKKMFIDYSILAEDDAQPRQKRGLAERICRALTVHAQLEEDVFYPAVRDALGDDALVDQAIDEHAAAKAIIERLGAMKATDAAHDASVKELGALIDQHVLEEREQMFLKARLAAIDLRGMTLPLLKRQQQLKKKAMAAPAEEAA
jgi:hemerythrin superfamily protein